MAEPKPIARSPTIAQDPEDWAISFRRKEKDVIGNVILTGFLWSWAVFSIIVGVAKILDGAAWYDITPTWFLGVPFALILPSRLFIPMHTARLEKKGRYLDYFVKGATAGIFDLKRSIPLTRIKSWYYSGKTKRIGFELPYTTLLQGEPMAPIENEETTFVLFSLKGMEEKDLASILDWFDSHYKRKEPADEDCAHWPDSIPESVRCQPSALAP